MNKMFTIFTPWKIAILLCVPATSDSLYWHLWLRNDSIFSSHEYTAEVINDLFAYYPRSRDPLTNTTPGLEQRPLASIVNAAPMICVQQDNINFGKYCMSGYLDCGFLPYGMYLSQNTFLEGVGNNIQLLINLAYVKIDKEQHHLFFGQYFHPLLRQEILPHVVSLNMGALITPGAVAPQIRYNYGQEDCWNIEATASVEYLYQSDGPSDALRPGTGQFSTLYLRESLLPDMCLHYSHRISHWTEFGIGVDTKRLIPTPSVPFISGSTVPIELTLFKKLSLQTTIMTGWLKIQQQLLTIKTQLLFGQNGTDIMNLGGYIMQDNDVTSTNPARIPVWYYSWWTDLEFSKFCRGIFQPGLYIGISKNLGTRKPFDQTLGSTYYGYRDAFDSGLPLIALFRCAPRCWIHINDQISIGLELEATRASFGNITADGTFTTDNSPLLLRLVASTQFYL